jgi:hypothetical protein
MCSDFLYNFGLKHFSFLEEFRDIISEMYIGLHVTGSQAVPSARTDMQA